MTPPGTDVLVISMGPAGLFAATARRSSWSMPDACVHGAAARV